MTATASQPYDWLKSIEPELIELQDLSTTGGPEGFAWDQLSARLAERFEIDDFQVSPAMAQWRDASEVQKGLGKRLWALGFAVASLPGNAALLITEKDVSILMSSLLTKEAAAPAKLDPDFLKGFFHYLGVEMVNILGGLGLEGKNALTFLPDESPPEGPGMCLDVDITLCGLTVRGRLVAGKEMTKAWKEQFSQGGKKRLNPKIAAELEVTMHLEAGEVVLKPSELASLTPGDFLILDTCSVLPGEEKGRVVMTVSGIPIFRGMLKQDKIKVLEYPLYHKVDAAMDDNEETLDETDEDVDSDEAEGAAALGDGPSTQERAGDIPLTVAVEVGRVRMKLEKLMELQPGQLLELDVHPEEGVDLVVNGRRIGKGELLRLGEALGVRILEIG